MKDIELKSSDELLNEEDYEILDKVIQIKKHIMSYYSKEKIVDKIKEIIINSEVVNFRNERSSKFISTKRPVFTLKVDKKKSYDIYDGGDFFNNKEEVDYFNNIIYHEVINNVSTFLIESYNDIDDNILDGISPEKIKVATGLLSSICGTRVNNDDKSLITLEFLL